MTFLIPSLHKFPPGQISCANFCQFKCLRPGVERDANLRSAPVLSGKSLYRRKGKGRRCCLGERIYSIPCRAIYFAPGRFEEKDGGHETKWRNYNKMADSKQDGGL